LLFGLNVRPSKDVKLPQFRARKLLIGVITAAALVIVICFLPTVQIAHTTEHRYTETFYEDGELKERLVIDFDTEYEYITIL